ncbi:MAG: ribosomal protein S18-alanine N-acetyltransferase [Sphingomonadaceae bacterium]
MIITTATACDIDAIMPVMASSFDPQYGEAWTLAQCVGMLSLPGSWLLVAQAKGRTIGFALSRIIVDEAELLLLAVTRTNQHAGIGSALLTHVLDDARKRGANRLYLEVRSNNGARDFYTNHGFVACGERQNYYRGIAGQLTNAVTLSRQISF